MYVVSGQCCKKTFLLTVSHRLSVPRPNYGKIMFQECQIYKPVIILFSNNSPMSCYMLNLHYRPEIFCISILPAHYSGVCRLVQLVSYWCLCEMLKCSNAFLRFTPRMSLGLHVGS